MERSQVIDNIRQVAARVLPRGSKLYLYGSRARGDYHEDSDLDLLLLLNDKGDSDETSIPSLCVATTSGSLSVSIPTRRTSGTMTRTLCSFTMSNTINS